MAEPVNGSSDDIEVPLLTRPTNVMVSVRYDF